MLDWNRFPYKKGDPGLSLKKLLPSIKRTIGVMSQKDLGELAPDKLASHSFKESALTKIRD
jgi:hypothetical protein